MEFLVAAGFSLRINIDTMPKTQAKACGYQLEKSQLT